MINIGDNFNYQGKQPNFVRDTFATLADMKNYLTTSVDEGHVSYCIEDNSRYIFSDDNTIDNTLGKWRRFVDAELNESSENPILNKAVNSRFNVIQDSLDSKVDRTVTINGQTLDNDVSLTKSDVGLGLADNTSDLSKPISNATASLVNEINMDITYPLVAGTYYTLNTAITAVTDSRHKKTGVKLTFSTTIGIYETWLFKSSIENWLITTNWERINVSGKYGNLDIITDLNSILRSGDYTAYGTAAHVPDINYSWFINHINSSVGISNATLEATAYSNTIIKYKRNLIGGTWSLWILLPSTAEVFYYSYNIKKTYDSIVLMNEDVTNPIGIDGNNINIGDIVTVVNSILPSENAIYSRIEGDWLFQSGMNFALKQYLGSDANSAISQKIITEILDNSIFSIYLNELNSISTEEGALNSSGNVVTASGYFTKKFNIFNENYISVSGRSGAGNFCLYCLYDSSDSLIYSGIIGAQTTYEKLSIDTKGAYYIKISGPIVNCYQIVRTPSFYTKLETYNTEETYNKEEVNTLVENINDKISTLEVSGVISVYSLHSGNALNANGTLSPNAGYNCSDYIVDGMLNVAITGRSPASSSYALAVAFDSSNNFIKNYYVGMGTDYNKIIVSLPDNAHLLRVMHYSSVVNAANLVIETPSFYTKSETYNKEEVNSLVGNQNYWTGKTIWWCGTSIPAGSDATLGSEETVAGNYPTQVGTNLGATVINKAVGGSMCRANVRTGDYNGANISNITSALSMTNEEVELFIANYDTIRQLSGNSSWPVSLSSSDLSRLRAASFENRLLPYLNGTYSMPDLFVIDHGHNDFKYKLPDNSSDIGLEPTLSNISLGILSEDIFMTANSNAKLESFMGSLANIPSAKKNDFIASLNRNCYIGAVNFIVTLILKYNPHARILFVSNYEYENGDYTSYSPLIPAQEYISKSWALPLCKVYEYLGFSNKIIPNSMNWFNSEYPSVTPSSTDVTVFRAYCPDTVHPHSDTTGDSNKIYAGILSEFLKKCR